MVTATYTDIIPQDGDKRTRWALTAAAGNCPWCGSEVIRETVTEAFAVNGSLDVWQCVKFPDTCQFEVPCMDNDTAAEFDSRSLSAIANHIEDAGVVLQPIKGATILKVRARSYKASFLAPWQWEECDVTGAVDITSGEVVLIYYPGRCEMRRYLRTVAGAEWLQLGDGSWIPAPEKYRRFYMALVMMRKAGLAGGVRQ